MSGNATVVSATVGDAGTSGVVAKTCDEDGGVLSAGVLNESGDAAVAGMVTLASGDTTIAAGGPGGAGEIFAIGSSITGGGEISACDAASMVTVGADVMMIGGGGAGADGMMISLTSDERNEEN